MSNKQQQLGGAASSKSNPGEGATSRSLNPFFFEKAPGAWCLEIARSQSQAKAK
jgi:hypothetical protein